MNAVVLCLAVFFFLFLAGFAGAEGGEVAPVAPQAAVIEVVVNITTPNHLVRDFTGSLKVNLARYLRKTVGREIRGRWLLLVTESATGDKPTIILSAFGDREGGGFMLVNRLSPAKLGNPAVAGRYAALKTILVIRDEVLRQRSAEVLR